MKFKEEMQNIIKNRLSNPIMGTFFMVWVISNWKFVLIMLFGDQNINEKIVLLDGMINAEDMIITPILYTLGYIVLLPYITYFVKFYTAQINKKTQQMETRIKLSMHDHISEELDVEIIDKAINETKEELESYLERKLYHLNLRLNKVEYLAKEII